MDRTVRYPQGHKKEAHARLVAAAGRGFRKNGFGGIGVDGLAREAEVTSGAFYGHFKSKGAAFKEAVVAGLDELRDGVLALRQQHGADWLEPFVDFYLGFKRTCELGQSCGLQSLTPEVGRADSRVRAAYERHLQAVVEAVAEGLPGGTLANRRRRAWALLVLLPGAVTLARATASAAVSEEIAAAVRATALKAALTAGTD